MKRRQFLTGVATLAAYGGLARAQSVTPQIGGGINRGFDGGISGSGSGGPTLWTPAQLGAGLVAWWDANQGVVLSGSNVTSWTSRVGSIVATPGTGTPTFSATARNGKPGVVGNGSQFLHFSPASLPSGTNPLTIAVAGFMLTSGATAALFSYGGTGANPLRAVYNNASNFVTVSDNASTTFAQSQVWSGNDRLVIWQTSAGDTTWQVNVDGGTLNAGATSSASSIALTSGNMFSWTDGSFIPAAGTLQQILILNRVLTLDESTKLAGWESWYDGKNGSNLPVNSPYKTRPPYVSDTTNTGAVRQIANITSYPEQFTTGNAQAGVIQPFVPIYDMYSVQIVIPNCGGEDVSSGGTLSATASLEYPTGVFTPITFGGSGTGSTSGLLLTSDVVNLSTPVPTGVAANIRIHGAHTNSTFGSSPSFQSNLGYVTQFGATVTDVTAGGTLTNSAANLAFGACVIAGRHNGKAVAAFGDSICFGTGSTGNNNNTPVGGVIVPSLFGLVPTVNAGLEGSTANGLLNNGVARKAIAQFFTHVASNFGTNDLGASGRTAAQLIGDIDALITLYAPIPFYQGTIIPRATSTDNFATAVNQTTVLPFNTDKNTVNAHIRALSKRLLIGDALEDVLNSGIWVNPGDGTATAACTASDGVHAGLHPTQTGYNVVQTSGTAAPSVFT